MAKYRTEDKFKQKSIHTLNTTLKKQTQNKTSLVQSPFTARTRGGLILQRSLAHTMDGWIVRV